MTSAQSIAPTFKTDEFMALSSLSGDLSPGSSETKHHMSRACGWLVKAQIDLTLSRTIEPLSNGSNLNALDLVLN